MKKVIKAHEGMAHVPKPSASKAKGTAGTTPRRRSIGLPQKFMGGRRRAPMLQTLAPVRRAPVMQEPKFITPPKPVVRPPRQTGPNSDIISDTFVRELPNKGRGKNIRRPDPQDKGKGRGKNISIPEPQVRSAQAPRTPMVQRRILNQGGYVSRAKYGQVDNLKKGK